MNRHEVMVRAWQIRRTGKSWSESLKAAWNQVFFDSLDFGPARAGFNWNWTF
jgi:hypothetical protein